VNTNVDRLDTVGFGKLAEFTAYGHMPPSVTYLAASRIAFTDAPVSEGCEWADAVLSK
jgi:hypothetical protein